MNKINLCEYFEKLIIKYPLEGWSASRVERSIILTHIDLPNLRLQFDSSERMNYKYETITYFYLTYINKFWAVGYAYSNITYIGNLFEPRLNEFLEEERIKRREENENKTKEMLSFLESLIK